MTQIDHLVVGAGTAGCVLAARLSEDPAKNVVLVEAGPDFPDEHALPSSLLDGDGTGYDAGLSAVVCAGRRAALARGQVVGGSSQVNGSGALRARADDFREWAALGLPEWDWNQVLASYVRMETDLDFSDRPYHGAHGPLPVTRPGRSGLNAPTAGFLEAVLAAGHPYQADMNAPDAQGIGPYPQNRSGNVRMSANLTHLAPVRSRPNLTVRANTPVDRVLLRRGRAVGVETAGEHIEAREVILCAGAPMTPALLLRSGIGPEEELRAAGVEPRVVLPGVGRALHDQPGAVLPTSPKPGTVPEDLIVTGLVARLDGVFGARGSFYLNLFTGPDPFEGEPSAALMVGDLSPNAEGRVTLSGPDRGVPPEVDLGFYNDPADLERMRAAYRLAWSLAQHPRFAETVDGVVTVNEELVADDERLDGLLQEITFNRGALMGGACMGADGDPDAVVDSHCRVRDVANLRVVDLSVVPVRLRSTSALEAMLLGEHTAGWIAEGR